ncbi:MAG: 4-hydroxythreonine-4-phosphate dehydrogenase PdxA [Planctomycetaceae bacterium]|nr:4-hydroxythreonine-4-phosphate dehydrogenase PdxA [Planctomycetaceae bacterium]
MSSESTLPRIALTLGDIAGIGPEVVARAISDPRLLKWCRPIVFGHPEILRQALRQTHSPAQIQVVSAFTEPVSDAQAIPVFNPSNDAVLDVPLSQLDARAGKAAYEYLVAAARAALRREIEAITTAPLNKAALHLAGLQYPGHTEILAEECGVTDFGMMLYLPPGDRIKSPQGLGVVHVTLHTSIRSVPDLISTAAVREKIGLIDGYMRRIGCVKPRLAVCALNPHAGEDGIFGDEESRLIAPAVRQASTAGINVQGPLPADTLMKRAVAGEFDAVVAMYHDQGHIALKLIGFDTAVNVTLGLPIVRTSPSHGTAFDIAGQNQADATGFLEAVRIASLLAIT